LVVCQKVVQGGGPRGHTECDSVRRRAADRLEDGKDPCAIEVILRETARIVRRGPGVLICETHHGFVCANAGVDSERAGRRRSAAAPRSRCPAERLRGVARSEL
jgi:F420-0:gamma-glutamyl ligase